MKKQKLFISVLLALLLSVCISHSAFAAGNVTYRGKADGVIFNPGTEEKLTDLFTNFKNVMPGDELEETIEVRNDAEGDVKIYLRALGTEESVEEFLSQMKLRIDHSTDSELFNAAANEITGLEDWVLLGTLASGGNETLNLILTVPIEMGNEYQNATGIINWEFKVEDFTTYDDPPATTVEKTPTPIPTTDKETPPTTTVDKKTSPPPGDTPGGDTPEGKDGPKTGDFFKNRPLMTAFFTGLAAVMASAWWIVSAKRKDRQAQGKE